LSVLSERRVYRPYGLKGGHPGKAGKNLLIRKKDGAVIDLGGKCSIPVEPGDTFCLLSPGGGGYGSLAESDDQSDLPESKRRRTNPQPGQYIERGSVHAYKVAQESA